MIVSRLATMSDAKFLFELANDPTTRAMSFNTDPIEWRPHLGWLARVLDDPNRRLWVGETADYLPMSTYRLDVDGGYEVVSLSIAPEWRGKGLARHIINALTYKARLPLLAEIKAENVASIRAFEGCGFVPDGPGRWVSPVRPVAKP